MHRNRIHLLVGGLLLLALPALAAETVLVSINADSPHMVGTGLVAQEGDIFLVQAEGIMNLVDFGPFTSGWFEPSGLGRLERVGQVFPDTPYGILIGTFYSQLENGLVLGELAAWDAQPAYLGQELKLGLNMSQADQAAVQGVFKVWVTKYTEEEMEEATVTIAPDSPRPLGTGIVAQDGDQFLVLAQGSTRVFSGRPVTQGWFGPNGLGWLSRGGQVFEDMPFGSVLGTFGSALGNGFYVGDVASWDAQPVDEGDEFKVGLNMDADDQAAMEGEIQVHVLRIADVVVSSVDGGEVPDRDAILSVDSYPNPFNPMTTVRFALAGQQRVRVSIVNVAGEVVRTLADRTFAAGQHELIWDGRDERGRGQASGTYLLRLETADAAESRKLTLVR